VLCGAFLTTGCGQREPVTTLDPENVVLFCDVEEPRRFSQEELDWRSANAPWNLRRDFKTNATWDREECQARDNRGGGF
jgi:hypothetical protein